MHLQEVKRAIGWKMDQVMSRYSTTYSSRMTSNNKLLLSDRFGIMKSSKTTAEEDTCDDADNFKDEYIKLVMTRQPTMGCFSSSMLITSDDEELNFKMENSWKEHFETCLKGNTRSKKEPATNAKPNKNIAEALKTARIEFNEQHGCWKENRSQNQSSDMFKSVEKGDISLKANILEEIDRPDIVATGVLENTEGIKLGKNQNKGKMQENCTIISESKTDVEEEIKQAQNTKDEKIVSSSSPTKRKREPDEGSEENYVSLLDAVYNTNVAENSSGYLQKEKKFSDFRTRSSDTKLKQPRFYPSQNDMSTDKGDIRRNSYVYRNGSEKEASHTMSPYLNSPSMSYSNCPQESVTSTQNSSITSMERDPEIVMHSTSTFLSSKITNYNSTFSHGYTNNSQDNVSELELLERTLNVPSGFYARKICQNNYKPPDTSQPMEQSFMSETQGFYRERDFGQPDHREKTLEGSPGKEELFQTLLQQCSALVHTKEDQKALEAVIRLISHQAGGQLNMKQDTSISNAVTTTMNEEQPFEKEIIAESCHSTTIDDSSGIGFSPEEVQFSSHKKEELFEGRTLLKGGVQPRHIPKMYIPKPSREPPFDPRMRLDTDEQMIISLPLPKFCAEILKLKKAGKLNVSFNAEKFELLEISCSPKNESHDGEGSGSNSIVHEGRSTISKPFEEDALAVPGTPVKDEIHDTNLMNQTATNRIYGKLNLSKCDSTSSMNKSLLEMETIESMKDIIDKDHDGMQQNLYQTSEEELKDKTEKYEQESDANSKILQERDVSEGMDKLSTFNTKNNIDYVMESVTQLLTSVRDQVSAGLEQEKVEEFENLHITKENTQEMMSTPIREELRQNTRSTDDQVSMSDKMISNTNENKFVIKDLVQMPCINKEWKKSTETSVAAVVKPMMETFNIGAANNEHMKHANVINASSVTLRANISNIAVNIHESVKTSNSNITAACTVRKPLFTFKLNKNLGNDNETHSSTQVQSDDTVAAPAKEEKFGSKHTSDSKEENSKEKLKPEVQISIDLSKGQPFFDKSAFQKCELYDPSSPTETIVEEVSMELDLSLEEGEIYSSLKSVTDISPNVAETGDEKGSKALEVMRSKWKETFCTIEREKAGESSEVELVLRKTLLESMKKDTEDSGASILESGISCGTSKSQMTKGLRLSNYSCCDNQDSRSRDRCKKSRPLRKGSNQSRDRHRKTQVSKRSRSRSGSSTNDQDLKLQPLRKGSNHIKDRQRKSQVSKRSKSRSGSSSSSQDLKSRGRWHKSQSRKEYDRDRSWIRHSPSKDRYSRNHSQSRSHHCYHHSCRPRSIKDSSRSSERSKRSPSDESHKQHDGTLIKDNREDTNTRHHRDRKRHQSSLNNHAREDHVVIHLKNNNSSRSSTYISSEYFSSPAFHSHPPAFDKDVEERCVKKHRESFDQLEVSAFDGNRLSTKMHTETRTSRDDNRHPRWTRTPEEFVPMRRKSYEWQEWQYYNYDTFEGNSIIEYEGDQQDIMKDSIPKKYRGKFANKY